jgi:AraC family cel operon transcriptional repressor
MNKLYHSDFIDPYLQSYYRFITEKTLFIGSHTHDFWEFFIMTNGEIDHMLNGNFYSEQCNSLILIRPNDEHELKAKSCFKMINFSMTHSLVSEICNFLHFDINILTTNEKLTVCLTSSQLKSLVKQLRYIVTIDSRNIMLVNQLQKVVALNAISFFIQSMDISLEDKKIPQYFHKLLREINDPQILEEGLPAIYRLCQCSPSHLNRLFKKYVGKPAIKYLTDIRMNYAANLLVNSDIDILQISMLIGYNSLSHFNHVFKENFKVSPSFYRNKSKNSRIN